MFNLACVGTAIARRCVAIVTCFAMLNDAIAAAARTLACGARGFAKITFFFTAAVVAAVVGFDVAIVAVFAVGYNAVAAGCCNAAFADCRTNITRFDLTRGGTAVAGGFVAIVALFKIFIQNAVAIKIADLGTVFTFVFAISVGAGRCAILTHDTGFGTAVIAAVTGRKVAVIALFACIVDAVAAGQTCTGGAYSLAFITLFDSALIRAAVAGSLVLIIAAFVSSFFAVAAVSGKSTVGIAAAVVAVTANRFAGCIDDNRTSAGHFAFIALFAAILDAIAANLVPSTGCVALAVTCAIV